jgi:hypothetical protein
VINGSAPSQKKRHAFGGPDTAKRCGRQAAHVYKIRARAYHHEMQFDWKLFLTALGLAFILEGLPYFLAAEKMPAVLRALAERRPGELRGIGMSAILAGVALLFVLRSLRG